jgi:arylsulfatase
MAVYAAQIEAMDSGIGRIVGTLRDHEALEDTLIVFVVDNGGCAEFLAEDGTAQRPGNGTTRDGRPVTVGNLPTVRPGPETTFMSYDVAWSNVSNVPFRRHKSWVHEGGIATPAVVHWPRGFGARGELRHATVHLVDLAPTIYGLAGAAYPDSRNGLPVPPLVGEDIRPSFDDPAWRRRRPLWFEHEGNRALRSDEWKLVNRFPHRWELYRIDEDRTELVDLAESEAARVVTMAGEWATQAAAVGVEELDAIWELILAKHGANDLRRRQLLAPSVGSKVS